MSDYRMTPRRPGFAITGSKGFHITFKNGWTISVQFGPANYADNYDMPMMSFVDRPPERLESSCAEIAYWGPTGQMESFGDDTVKGYVSPEDVLALMKDIAAR